ncbi:MAG: hypothetical protein WA146_06565 [Thiobacillus sp.]
MRTTSLLTLLCLSLMISGRSEAVTTNDLKTARPAALLKNMYAACQRGNQEQMFALHTKSFEQALLRAPAAKRSEIFAVYCQGIRQIFDQQLRGDPEGASYFIKGSDRTKNGQKKSTLCIVPKGQPVNSCTFGFDVAIEGGLLKKDEF